VGTGNDVKGERMADKWDTADKLFYSAVFFALVAGVAVGAGVLFVVIHFLDKFW
jgi:hypothetical protein